MWALVGFLMVVLREDTIFSCRNCMCSGNWTLTPATACIEAVMNILSVEAFDGQEVVLLDKDNLRIPDNHTIRSKINPLI